MPDLTPPFRPRETRAVPGLRSWRLASSLTQQAVAEELCVTRSDISAWELGRARMPAGLAARLCAVFGLEPDVLLNEPETTVPPPGTCPKRGLPS